MCSLRYWAASMGRPESTHPVAPSRSAFVATPCFRREPDTSPVRPHDGLNLSHHCNGLTCPYLPNGFQLELSRVLRTHLLFTHLSTPCRYFQQGLRTPLFRGNLRTSSGHLRGFAKKVGGQKAKWLQLDVRSTGNHGIAERLRLQRLLVSAWSATARLE